MLSTLTIHMECSPWDHKGTTVLTFLLGNLWGEGAKVVGV